MTIVYNTAIKNARLTVVSSAIDADQGAGKIRIYDAGQANLLVDVPFVDPCALTIAGGVLTFAMPVIEPVTLVSGTAVEATLASNDGTVVASGLSVGTDPSFDIHLNSTQLTAGEPCRIISASITHG